MTTPRRTIIRTPPRSAASTGQRVLKLRARLERERSSLTRWVSRMKRSFHAMERQQAKVARIERQLAREEATNHDPRDG